LADIRCERPFGLDHVENGGGDASPVDTIEAFEYVRPSGLSHVEDGGGDVLKRESRQQSVGHWLIRDHLSISQVKFPTEVKKKELGQELADSEPF
jgi:hypothetical protein